MTNGSAASDWIATHRGRWARKASVRAVYGAYFRRLRNACASPGPIVEIGCGPAFFKECHPEVIAIDVIRNPHADVIADAAALPYGDGALGNIVLLDVFHHLPAPAQFLREVARTLRPGGRLVMIEPWTGVAGRWLYTYLHHETCDATVDPAAPWSHDTKDPMEGNVALPSLYFAAGGHLPRLGLPLRVTERDPFAALPWLLSGGFQPPTLLPARWHSVAAAADRLLSRVPAWTATRCFIAVEKTS